MKIKCSYCGKEVEKLSSEINRQKKNGKTNFYCNLSCSGKANSSHLDKWHGKYNHNLKRGSKTDEFSQFRPYLRYAKKRKECDIDLDYLKELWEKQKGKCELTKIDMTLDRKHQITQASLDRIDSNKGYVKNNVRFICLIMNYAKNSWTDENVLEFLSKAFG